MALRVRNYCMQVVIIETMLDFNFFSTLQNMTLNESESLHI